MKEQKVFYINTVCSTNNNINDDELLNILCRENNHCKEEHNRKIEKNVICNYKQKNNSDLNKNYIRFTLYTSINGNRNHLKQNILFHLKNSFNSCFIKNTKYKNFNIKYISISELEYNEFKIKVCFDREIIDIPYNQLDSLGYKFEKCPIYADNVIVKFHFRGIDK